MSLKTVIIICIIGTVFSVLIDVMHIFEIEGILRFLYRSTIGNVLRSIPNLTLLAFFVALLIKQK